MAESAYRNVFLAPEEVELLELLRGEGDCSLTVTRTEGRVLILLTLPYQPDAGRGEGATFPEAWSKIAPYWA